jgi:hypothetical protein
VDVYKRDHQMQDPQEQKRAYKVIMQHGVSSTIEYLGHPVPFNSAPCE